jgi:hypothetical protein
MFPEILNGAGFLTVIDLDFYHLPVTVNLIPSVPKYILFPKILTRQDLAKLAVVLYSSMSVLQGIELACLISSLLIFPDVKSYIMGLREDYIAFNRHLAY